eukprot:1473367-Rhodomonas_salina.1
MCSLSKRRCDLRKSCKKRRFRQIPTLLVRNDVSPKLFHFSDASTGTRVSCPGPPRSCCPGTRVPGINTGGTWKFLQRERVVPEYNCTTIGRSRGVRVCSKNAFAVFHNRGPKFQVVHGLHGKRKIF